MVHVLDLSLTVFLYFVCVSAKALVAIFTSKYSDPCSPLGELTRFGGWGVMYFVGVKLVFNIFWGC